MAFAAGNGSEMFYYKKNKISNFRNHFEVKTLAKEPNTIIEA